MIAPMRQKFYENYDVVKMTRSSVVVRHKRNGSEAFMHRNAFNQLDNAEGYRVVEKSFHGNTSYWVEVLVWQAL